MKLNRQAVIFGVIGFALGVIVTVVAMVLGNRTRPAAIYIEPPLVSPTPSATATPEPVQVYVNGAVNRTGVYDLGQNAIVQDAIGAAGGFSAEADSTGINLALSIVDGMQIYVPTIGEEPVTRSQPAIILPANVADSDNAAQQSGAMVNINTATVGELDTLPGIGPSTAQKIVDYRDENGPFASIETILNVSGIGEAKFDQIEPFITIGP
jgi:competence protein ComEA